MLSLRKQLRLQQLTGVFENQMKMIWHKNDNFISVTPSSTLQLPFDPRVVSLFALGFAKVLLYFPKTRNQCHYITTKKLQNKK